MNGWWWNPAEPGRGFFLELRDGRACIACCGYDEQGRPQWHTAGPVEPDAAGALEARTRRMRLPVAPDEAAGAPLRLVPGDAPAATLDWDGARIPLELQYRELHDAFADEDDRLSGWWVEAGAEPRVAIVCEAAAKRLFAVRLDADGWTMLEATRSGDAAYAGKWWRFEGGQWPGGPHRMPTGRELGPGEIRAGARGDLVAVMSRGGERSFVRFSWPAPASDVHGAARAPRLKASVSSPATSDVHCGLVPIHVELSSDGGFAEESLRFELSSGASREVLFEKDVRLGGRARRIRLVVNSHLLADGTVPLVARVLREGGEVWRDTIGLRIANEGPLAAQVRASLQRSGAPLVIEGAIDSTHFDMRDRSLTPWFDRPDALGHVDELRRAGRIDAQTHYALAKFVREGYMVLPEAIEEPLLERIDAELDDAIAEKVQGYSYGSSQRIVNLHLRYPGVRALWRHPVVMRHLELIFGVPARPCQTLTYIFGSQQEAHQDTVHLTPFPAGYMCGVWVALEDVRPDSGELQVFPGTHGLPRVYMSDAGCAKVTGNDWDEFGEKVVGRYRSMLDARPFDRVTYRPRRGTVLIWHENLLHGGSPRVDLSRSRRSIVSHYFAEGGIAFYDSTGLPGHMG